MQFIDLRYQYLSYKDEIDAAIREVLDSSSFIDGPPVRELESRLAEFTGTPHVIACTSGTDALYAGLVALNLAPGDEVIVPDFTFFATAEVVVRLGAKPVFADISSENWTIDPLDVARKISSRTKGIIPVSLFGQCADMRSLNELARSNHLWIFEDAAQSFGATQNDEQSCNLSSLACTSFFPSKPLGAYGNGGAVFCQDSKLAQRLRSILSHGQEARYEHTSLGINGRMDSLQAAVLLVKLRHLQQELKERQRVADSYLAELKGIVGLPSIMKSNTSVWAQFSVTHEKRDLICEHLAKRGIPTSIHYPKPLHSQHAFAHLATSIVVNPVTETTCRQIFSLPCHPFMAQDQIVQVCDAIKDVVV